MRNKSIIKIFFKKNIFIYFLLCIEIILSIFLVYNILKEFSIKTKISKLDSYYWNNDNSYSLSLNPIDFNNNIDTALNSFYKDLSNIEGVSNKGIIFNDYLFAKDLPVDYFNEIHVKFSGFGSLVANNFNGDDNSSGIPLRFVDYNYLKPLNLVFTDGSINEDNLNINSIFLGNNFRNYYNIDDQINLNEKNYTIQGFIKKNTAFRFDKDFYEANPFTDDSGLIILTDNIIESPDTLKLISLMGGIQVCLSEDYDSKFILEKITNLSHKYNLNLTLSNNREVYENRIAEAKSATDYTIIRSLIFLIISIISLSVILLYSIYDSKKEIGVAILVGAKKTDIIIITCLKIIFVASIGFIGGTVMSNYISITGGGYFEIDTSYPMIIIAFIITLLFILITLILPIRKILNMDIKTLIGGEK